MKAVIQRVNKAAVTKVDSGEIVGKIGLGLFILLGVDMKDSEEDAKKLANKISNLRIMADKDGKMNLSITNTSKEILVVSQFTLLSDIKKGNRPSFLRAGEPKRAQEIYEYFIYALKNNGLNVETGSFGDYMNISAELDGPVTIVI